MTIRYNIFPKIWFDRIPFLFVCSMIAITYWFELWVVAPGIFGTYSASNIFLFLLGNFLLLNVVGNFIGILMVDTSIKGRIMPTEMKPGTKFCAVCETIAPPRSYHCNVCKICILKRDHHCTFAGYCIGQYNYRYFVLFLTYLFLSTLIALPFNIYFLWDHLTSSDVYIIPKVLFPVLAIMITTDFTIHQFYIVIFVINIGGMAFIGAWAYFHWRLIVQGKIVHEMRNNINTYDYGTKNNIMEVLGVRYYMVWLSPFIYSMLPHDGIDYDRDLIKEAAIKQE